jgi:hypothetical protein
MIETPDQTPHNCWRLRSMECARFCASSRKLAACSPGGSLVNPPKRISGNPGNGSARAPRGWLAPGTRHNIDENDDTIEHFNYRLSGERDTVSPMERILMNVSDRKHNRSLFLWSLGGFIIAASIRCADILPDFFRRLHVALTGGVGESAVWDEPLFYMAIMGFPAGLIGALIAFAIAFAVRRRTKSK